MTVFVKSVDPNGGADYSSGSAWVAGEQGLYTAADIARADARQTGATQDTTAFTISGFVATPEFIADPTTGYVVNAAGTAVTVNNTGAIFDGVTVTGWGTSGSTRRAIQVGAGNVRVQGCFIHAPATGANNVGINLPNTATSTYAINNFVWSVTGTTDGTGIVSNNAANRIYNNTVFGCTTYGIRFLAAADAVNNVSMSNGTADYSGTAGGGSDKNVSSDATAPGTTVATGLTSYASYFVDHTTGDFHLNGSGLSLFGISGNDLSGTFTTDIDGQTRSAWDVGADEYIVSSGIIINLAGSGGLVSQGGLAGIGGGLVS